VLTDPAAVSGHLAICGAPTGAFQPLRCCRPAVKYLTRLNRVYFRYGPRVALSTLSPIRYLLRPKTRFPVRRLHLLSGREFHPLEAPGLSWRTIVEIYIAQQYADRTSLRGSLFTRMDLSILQYTCPQPAPDQTDQALISHSMFHEAEHPFVA
jgi:hypothetical protein